MDLLLTCCRADPNSRPKHLKRQVVFRELVTPRKSRQLSPAAHGRPPHFCQQSLWLYLVAQRSFEISEAIETATLGISNHICPAAPSQSVNAITHHSPHSLPSSQLLSLRYGIRHRAMPANDNFMF